MPTLCAISGGFYALEVTVPKKHYVYMRKHVVREDEESDETPAGRTLFVTNIPTTYTESTIMSIFKAQGSGGVSKVTIHRRSNQKHTRTLAKELYGECKDEDDLTRFSHVVFKSEKQLEKFIKVKKDVKAVESTERLLPVGMEKWAQECQLNTYPDISVLSNEIAEAMVEFDALEAKRKALRKAAKNKPDDDGWVTVSYGKKANALNDLAEEERLRKKKTRDMSNLYKWQQRETRREEIADLRKNFEDDKQKIQLLRMQRKFKPY
ncbi:hypothetical protein SARC_03503 [Sphaeroforma arctica JP610]|uniref:RRM domain-containing protein n=1 Tax=Sphaeroforma arctica JP610 TaxID=667725 RepID=A0A0L0G5G3_9EUKA|nr:hypothetical protein SARC_03503 [Sphaeroforma arctica JP610]KNC84277.1 hypothetical protein SARC_03503 [Sphaeroforma arctica JP610]|eukprot:XP_014158179.1 hypothetical protein SARC_03503 [Sphaeroforma arctica JP610]